MEKESQLAEADEIRQRKHMRLSSADKHKETAGQE
jgi:hypothetical protein